MTSNVNNIDLHRGRAAKALLKETLVNNMTKTLQTCLTSQKAISVTLSTHTKGAQ